MSNPPETRIQSPGRPDSTADGTRQVAPPETTQPSLLREQLQLPDGVMCAEYHQLSEEIKAGINDLHERTFRWPYFRDFHKDLRALFFLYRLDAQGNVIGMVAIRNYSTVTLPTTLNPDAAFGGLVIEGLAVDQSQRGSGMGKDLTAAALQVAASNWPSVAAAGFYERLRAANPSSTELASAEQAVTALQPGKSFILLELREAHKISQRFLTAESRAGLHETAFTREYLRHPWAELDLDTVGNAISIAIATPLRLQIGENPERFLVQQLAKIGINLIGAPEDCQKVLTTLWEELRKPVQQLIENHRGENSAIHIANPDQYRLAYPEMPGMVIEAQRMLFEALKKPADVFADLDIEVVVRGLEGNGGLPTSLEQTRIYENLDTNGGGELPSAILGKATDAVAFQEMLQRTTDYNQMLASLRQETVRPKTAILAIQPLRISFRAALQTSAAEANNQITQ